jgi:hypothetical protein
MGDGTGIAQPRRVYKMKRDSQGRARTEIWEAPYQPGENGGFTFTEVHDPVGGFYYVLDAQNQIAHRVALATLPPGSQAATSSRVPPTRSVESLGTINIVGVRAVGTRTTTTFPDDNRPYVETQESWYSPELKMVVQSRFSDLARDSTSQMISLSRAEPDASVFEVPAGYAVVDEKGSFTVTVKKQ